MAGPAFAKGELAFSRLDWRPLAFYVDTPLRVLGFFLLFVEEKAALICSFSGGTACLFRITFSIMWKNLKSLFIIEEPSPEQEAGETEPRAGSRNTAPAAATESPGATGQGQVTEKFTEILLKAMESADTQGFDYLEFKRSLQSLNQVSMDESTRFRSAFAMAQTMGATPDSLIRTAGHYADTLKGELEKFEEAVAKQKELQIGSKQTEIAGLEAAVKAKEEQIRQLTAEIGDNQARMESLRQEIGSATAKVESTRNDFLASYKHLVGQIQGDIAKMDQFLKQTGA